MKLIGKQRKKIKKRDTGFYLNGAVLRIRAVHKEGLSPEANERRAMMQKKKKNQKNCLCAIHPVCRNQVRE